MDNNDKKAISFTNQGFIAGAAGLALCYFARYHNHREISIWLVLEIVLTVFGLAFMYLGFAKIFDSLCETLCGKIKSPVLSSIAKWILFLVIALVAASFFIRKQGDLDMRIE